jgi:hypothetical protein
MNRTKRKYEPQSNVSNPLQNTRSDGQWDYRPVKKRANFAVKPQTKQKEEKPK